MIGSLGFRASCDFFSIIIVVYSIFLIALNGGCVIFRRDPDDELDKVDDSEAAEELAAAEG